MWKEMTQEAVISQGLSTRSKEFIADQKNDAESEWQYAKLDGEDKAGAYVGKRIVVGDCFSFVMVFRVTNPRQDADCSWYFGTEKPRGMVIVYMKEANGVRTTEQIDGVSMRQKFTEKYKESTLTIGGNEYLVFHGLESGNYEANVFLLRDGKAFVFNVITQSPDNFDKELRAMLESIDFR